MPLSSQQYADLSDYAYKTPEKNKTVDVNGLQYKVLDVVDDPKTGYQGAIYQRVDTGEIVVAHRGTEVTGKDILADAKMATVSSNPQIPQALLLTERALAFAQDEAIEFGKPVPEVTVTGHSLGGALAQVSAYEYGLKAETFNAYGAAGLNYTDSQGNQKIVPLQDNGKVINHEMAGDIVSAANHHFGKEVHYAKQNEIDSLKYWDYGDGNPNNNDMWRAAAMLTVKHGSHGIKNFTDAEGASVLFDSSARELATKEQAAIGEYRNEIRTTAGYVRGVGHTVMQVYDFVKEGVIEGVHSIQRGIDKGIDVIKDGLDRIGGGAKAAWNYLFSGRSESIEKTPQVEQEATMSTKQELGALKSDALDVDKMLAAYEKGDLSSFNQQVAMTGNGEAGQTLLSEGQTQAQQMQEEQQRQHEMNVGEQVRSSMKIA